VSQARFDEFEIAVPVVEAGISGSTVKDFGVIRSDFGIGIWMTFVNV
jgi:hypothetical protein